MIKIVHLITDLAIGGAEMVLCRLLDKLDRSRFDAAVVSMTDEGNLGGRLREQGIRLFTLRMRPGVADPRGLVRLWRILRSERPHVLQTWLYHADVLGLLAGRLAGVAAIAWNVRCADMDMRHYSRLSALTVRVLARWSSRPDVVVFNSEAGRRVHGALGYRPRSWRVIPNGIDPEVFRPRPEARASVGSELGLPEEALLIGLVARFDPMKDHDNFLRAAALLRDEEPPVHFVLAGRGVDRGNEALARRVAELGLNERVHLLGERDDIPRLTAALDVATCSSSGEGFPNLIGEAMACGVPCVSTDVGDAAWMLGRTGVVVPAKDPAALAGGWRRLVAAGPQARSGLGAAARKRVEQCFTLAGAVARYERLYEDLARARPEVGR